MDAPRSKRARARQRMNRGEHSRERSQGVGGALTQSGGEGGRRRKILWMEDAIVVHL